MTEPVTKSKTTTYLLLMVLLIGMVITAVVVYQVVSQPAEANAIITDATEYRGTVYDLPQELSSFTLPSSLGKPLGLSDLSSRWTVLFFGYTHCPDFCPTTLAEFKQIKTLLGGDAQAVQFVFVSVDSPRDTPEVLATYLRQFDPEFIGLSGDDETLARIGPEYGLYYERHTEMGKNYVVDHSTRTYLIDREGRLRVTYAYGTEPKIMAESIREQIQAG